MGLVAEHDDLELFSAGAAGQFLNESSACHSVADDDQALRLFHGLTLL
jgi:hypothetical protein